MDDEMTFKTRLVRPEGVGTWTFAPVPMDIPDRSQLKARMRVKGEIDGVPYRSSLMPAGGGELFVVVPKPLRDKIGKKSGDVVTMTLQLDSAHFILNVPNDLARALAKNPKAKAWFEKIAPSHRKAYVQWIEQAKKKETRQTRIKRAVRMLSEGETL
jgi:bifunctional DNA-binding transcriptional regulator/antitoxin component of YhaV-PrlF toxin-antitoxin module